MALEVLSFALKEGDTVGRVGKPQAPAPSGEGLPFVSMLVPTRETSGKGTGCQVNLNLIGKNFRHWFHHFDLFYFSPSLGGLEKSISVGIKPEHLLI